MRRYARAQYRTNRLQKRIMRILILLILLFSILATFLILGNILHDRLEKAQPVLSLPVIHYTDPIVPALPAYTHSFTPAEEKPGIFRLLSVTNPADHASLEQFCAETAGNYDGISVVISGKNGMCFSLTEEADKGAEKIPGIDTLQALTGFCRTAGLRICAVWELPDTVPGSDSQTCIAAGTLASLGFHEILFTGLTSASLHDRDIAAMAALTEAIRKKSASIQVGFALENDVFHDIASAQTLEKLAQTVDFLALDTGTPPENTEESAAYALTVCGALYGSIAYYPLRILLSGSPEALLLQTAALRDAGYTAIQPIG